MQLEPKLLIVGLNDFDMNEIPLHMYYNVQANGIWKFYPTMLVGPWQFISKVGHRVLKGNTLFLLLLGFATLMLSI
jgi:hypothetical protein